MLELESDEFNSTVRQTAVLLTSEEVTVTELAEKSGVERSTSQRTLDQLVDLGIIEKEGEYPAEYFICPELDE